MESVMADDAPCAPTLELDEIRLRPLRSGDAAALHAYLSQPAVTALTSFPPVTPALVEAIIARAASRWARCEPGKWGVALRSDDRVVGTCGFNDGSPPHRWAELAYDLAPEHWGQGVMQRALAAALGWAFERGDLYRVQAYVRVDNARSARLLERCGFSCEGRLRAFRMCKGEPFDFHVHSLLRPEWEAARAGR